MFVKQLRSYTRHLSHIIKGMDLAAVTSKLESYAPTHLAGSWDNVGLLIEPSPPHTVNKILLTNDLTMPVMSEALDKNVDLIVAYHPPLFSSFKTINQSSWKQQIAVKCLENRIAVYSPHTSWDAESNRVNDWLISPFGEGKPIEKAYAPGEEVKIEIPLLTEQFNGVKEELVNAGICSAENISGRPTTDHKDAWICIRCKKSATSSIHSILRKHVADMSKIEITSLCKVPLPNKGAGRIITQLATKITLRDAVEKIKSHLNLPHVRLATAINHTLDSEIGSVGVCAGSGSSVLRGVSADLYLTGEMSHHEVLDATHSKHSVVLCEHSNTERGFIHQVALKHLTELLGGAVEVETSEVDCDPLRTV